MSPLFCRCLLFLLPLLTGGCSFHYAKVCSLSLRCAIEPAAAEEAVHDPHFQLASAEFLIDAGTPCSVVFEPCPAPCVRPQWGGIYPTVLTPWNCDGTVDVDALRRQIDYQLAGGVHGLMVLGTLGEGAYTNEAGREVVIGVATQAAAGRVPVVVGIHARDAGLALAQMRQAKRLGAAAVLVKYTGCAGTEFCEVLGFYSALAHADSSAQLPIFIYYFPGQTGLTLTPEQLATLLSLPNVVGSKQSQLDLRHIEKQIALTAGLGRVFLSGTALNLTQFQGVGGHGAMCPEAALLPCRTTRAYQAAYELGDVATARALQKELFVVAPLQQALPISEGGARCVTMCTQDLKLPMMTGREASPAKLKSALSGLGVPMSPQVAPPQRQLSRCDNCQVNWLLPKLQSLAP